MDGGASTGGVDQQSSAAGSKDSSLCTDGRGLLGLTKKTHLPENDACEGGLQSAAPLGRVATLWTWYGLRSVPCARKKIWRSSISAASAVFSPSGFWRYPQRTPVVVDIDKIQARRHQVLVAMEGRPGQRRKRRVADEFDAFVVVISAEPRCWTTATPADFFDFLCYLDTQGKGTKMVPKHFARLGPSGQQCVPGSVIVRETVRSRVPPKRLCL